MHIRSNKDDELCREAIHHGISLARKYNAELSVINVMFNPFIRMNAPMMSSAGENQKE